MMYGNLEQKVRKFISKTIKLVLGKEDDTLSKRVRNEEIKIVDLIKYSVIQTNSEEQIIYGSNDVKVKKLKPYPGSTANTKVQAGSIGYDLSFLCLSKQAHIVVGIRGYLDIYNPLKIIFDLVEEGLKERGYTKERISGDFVRYKKTLVI